MAISRVLFRYFATLVIASFIGTTFALPAQARARIIAVLILRSTPAAHAASVAASKALAARLALEPGWDAVTVDPHGKSPADAAAAVGAELYVVGQYLGGSPPRVSGATYRVATDERLKDFAFDVSPSGGIPQSLTFSELTSEENAPSLTANSVANGASQDDSHNTAVPRGTVIVVAMDRLLNSYSAASREPLSYTVVQDVIVDGHIVAKAGDQATGIVLEAQHGNQGGPYGIGWKAANLRVDVEAVHNFCGDTIPTSFVRSEYRRRQGLFGAHQDLEIIKGQKYVASVARAVKVCSEATSSAPQPPPADALPPDDAPSAPRGAVISEETSPSPSTPPPAERSIAPPPPGELINSEARQAVIPPTMWIAKPLNFASSDFTNVGFWISPKQNETLGVIAQALPAGMSASQYVNLTVQSLRNSVGSQNVRLSRSDRVCNGTMDGWYVESSVIVGGTPMIAEQTIGVSGNRALIATYRRPSSQPEDPAALQSLSSLCPTAA